MPNGRRTTVDLFWSRVDKRGPGECWEWVGTQDSCGYGRISIDNRYYKAHRVVYELCVGEIPEELELDHVRARGCVSRSCVNPAHLEAVTSWENTLRGDNHVGVGARRTHCVNGHEFTPENTKTWKHGDGTRRKCRTCQLAHYRARRLRLKQVAA